jgi:hypothetical protein
MRVDSAATQSNLRSAGFDLIEEEVIQLPLNQWSRDPFLHELGAWVNFLFCKSLPGLSLAPLSRIKHRSPQDIMALVERAKQETCTLGVHAYLLL